MTQKSTNPIGFLQEYCQRAKTAAFPKYDDLEPTGPDHSREFSCLCTYDGFKIIGKGIQKKQAKSEAAKSMIDFLEKQDYFNKSSVKNIVSNTNLSDPSIYSSGVAMSTNPISALQEHCQKTFSSLPSYFESASGGGFVCECAVDGLKSFGNGSSKKLAKREAAMNMCKQLDIGVYVKDDLEKDHKEIEPIYSDKNAISALQELCAKNGNMAAPVYENKPSFLNQFVIACNVGSISAEGTDTTKKGAKLSAANKVLGILMERLQVNRGNEVSVPNKKYGSVKAGLDHWFTPHSELEDFPLENDEEDDDDIKSDKKNIQSNYYEDAFNQLQALTIDDSVVEVEPSTVNMKKVPHLFSLEHEIVQNRSNKNKLGGDVSSVNQHDDDRGGIQQLIKTEDKLCLLNVRGDVLIHSSSHMDSVIHDLQGQTVTLTGVVNKIKRGKRSSLKLDVFTLKTNKITSDGCTQKTSTSETLLKWAQKNV